MAQNPPQRCPRCGTPAEAGQRFCAECGAVLSSEGNKPTELASGDSFGLGHAQGAPQRSGDVLQPTAPAAQPAPSTPAAPSSYDPTVIAPRPGNAQPAAPSPTPVPQQGAAPYSFGSTNSTVPTSGAQFYQDGTVPNVIPPPPPADSYIARPQSMASQTPTPAPAPAPVQAPGSYTVPDYAKAPRRSRGCLIVSILLLLVLAAGAVGIYFGFFHKSGGQSNNNNTGTQTTGNTPTTGASSPTPGSSTTATTNGGTQVQLSLAFTYATISYTITSVQYAQSYPDDPSLTAGGVRVAFTESNTTSNDVSFGYNDVARLIMPDGSSIAPVSELHVTPPTSSTSGITNWIDFPVTSAPADLTALVLQMGAASENQMKIPLKPGANLSQYQPVTASPNVTFTYASIQWTITKATITYSAESKQATAGNIYVTLTLHAVNNSTNDFIDNTSGYMRMQEGSTVNAPVDNGTFTNSIQPSSTADGDVSFLMPQGNTSFTLVMLMQQGNPPIAQVTQNFQV